MSDHLMRGVRIQLTTTMDSVFKTAVFQVMRIFENALYDHKMEMAQKGEEIAQLKIKLQTAELKLKDFELINQRLEEGAISKTQTEPKIVRDDPGKSATVAEINVTEPDDWCAPLGYDTVTKQEEGICPSVRLRQFSIRLNPVPLVKPEVYSYPINVPKSPAGRRSRRISTLNKIKTPEKNEPVVIKEGRSPKGNRNLGKLVQNLNQDYCNLQGLDRLQKRNTNEEASSNNTVKEKKHEKKSSVYQVENKSTDRHVCGSCCRIFGTSLGLGVHLRSQKKCKGCSMVFCFQGAAKYHMTVCPKYKALNKARGRPKKTTHDKKKRGRPKKTTHDKKNAINSSKTKKIVETETTQSSPVGRVFCCKRCDFKTVFIKRYKKHIQSHYESGTKKCRLCLEKFDEKKALALHMIKEHTSQIQLGKKVDSLD